MNALRDAITMALVLCAFADADAGQSYFVTEQLAGRIHRLEDINLDGDALDVGERILWGEGLANAAELALYQSGILAIDSVADRALYYEDLNADGDALDAGESIVWADGFTNPFGVDVGLDDSVYLSDFATHQVFRARDSNADGDALDAGEKVLYAENIQGAASLLTVGIDQFVVAYNSGQVHLLHDTIGDGDALDAGENQAYTPNSIAQARGITPRMGGGYFIGSWFNDTIYRVLDRNGDGDAFDLGEVLSYADNVYGGFNNPWGMASVGHQVLVANSAAANVLALRDKNNDGDALDMGEVVVFADGINSPVDIVALPVGLLGDYNGDGTVDAADYVAWRKGVVIAPTQDNYNIWHTNFGRTAGSGSADFSVPEPTFGLTLLLGVLTLLSAWRRSVAFSS